MGVSGPSAKFGIAFGAFLGLLIVGWLVKVYINKRRDERHKKYRDIETATKIANREKLAARNLESRPSSPAVSYKLSPATSIVDWSREPKPHSPSSSRNSSVSSLKVPQTAARKPSPLRLASFESERTHTSTLSFGNVGGAYISPLPSPHSFKGTNTGGSSSWVSPLDVHFSRPSTPNPQDSKRPNSYLPRLNFPEEVGQNSLMLPTATVGSTGDKSETASIKSNTAPLAPTLGPEPKPLPTVEVPGATSATVPDIPPSAPQSTPSLATGRQHAILPISGDTDRPSSRKSNQSFPNIPIPAIPESDSYFPPRSPAFDPLFPESPLWNADTAVFRESIVSKRSVSIYRPKSTYAPSPDTVQTRGRVHSGAGSSVYSARTSIINEDQRGSNFRSRSAESVANERARSRSTSQKRSRSAHSLARTRDSVRRHSRKVSQLSLRTEKRRSRDRDQIHYDPTQRHRNRSGSVQGRSIDFDNPRESPFSNFHAISTHSTSSSQSSARSSALAMQQPGQEQMPKSFLELSLPAPDRLSVVTTAMSRGRSASEVSQVSIGEFYDAYYRQSILAAQHASGVNQVNNGNPMSRDMGVGISMTTSGRRPAPLNQNIKPNRRTLAGETIVEMPSPAPSPMFPFPHGEDKYPAMI